MKNENTNRYIFEKILHKNDNLIVYSGKMQNAENKLIIKLEKKHEHNGKLTSLFSVSTIEKEKRILDILKNINGIPKVIDSYKDTINSYLVTDYLGKDVEYLLNKNKQFSLNTTACFMIQSLTILQDIHEKNILHCDIKPSNFIYNYKNKQFYLIDFSVSQFEQQHNKSIVGTPKFCSIYCHDSSIPYGKRDDLISLAYIMIYMVLGYLPWQKSKLIDSNYTLTKIKERKFYFYDFIKNKQLPEEFEIYINYCMNLKDNIEPEYMLLRGLFIKMLKSVQYSKDNFITEMNTYTLDRNSLHNENNYFEEKPAFSE